MKFHPIKSHVLHIGHSNARCGTLITDFGVTTDWLYLSEKSLPISSSPTTPSTLEGRNLFLPFIRCTSDHSSCVIVSIMASAILVVHIRSPSLIMCLTAPWYRALVIRLISVISPWYGFPTDRHCRCQYKCFWRVASLHSMCRNKMFRFRKNVYIQLNFATLILIIFVSDLYLFRFTFVPEVNKWKFDYFSIYHAQ